MQLLKIVWDVNPEFFSAGPISLRYYGLMWATAFALGYFIFGGMAQRERLPQRFLDTLTIYMIVATVLGARLGHCLFYEPSYFMAHPLEVFAIWQGGLASHGAAVGILVAVGLVARRWGLPALYVLDRVVVPIALGGALVRLGNLMNSEIYGHATELPWGMVFVRAGEVLPKHPTQLYEALAYGALFVGLWVCYRRRCGQMPLGFVFGIFLVGLFAARFGIEFLKEPQVEFEQHLPLNMGQLLSLPFIAAGIYLIIKSLRSGRTFIYEPQ